MARRHKHEEHVNHEAWAIPYGDLITLLLAFFVVMYAMSSINEGKYRILSDSLVAAFRGSPRTLEPIQVGEKQVGSGADINVSIVQQAMLEGMPREMLEPLPLKTTDLVSRNSANVPDVASEAEGMRLAAEIQLETVAKEVEQAMAALIEENLIMVRRGGFWVEVEIRTDILFPSGVATLSPEAVAVLERLAKVLKPFPNPIRVEGHTDNRPINTREFPSNWELSSARAASVVHLFTRNGIDPARLAVIGLGEYRPVQSNDTPEGRNANRRVLLVILAGDGPPEALQRDDAKEVVKDEGSDDALAGGTPIEAAVRESASPALRPKAGATS
ncbi:MAG TPA: flagellar motor protein MotD [Steroidobacteraceae bacterium]|jgi:chemotaxis protein MotB